MGAAHCRSGRWSLGFALCLIAIAATAPRWNWLFWAGALVYLVRALVLFRRCRSGSGAGAPPDRPEAHQAAPPAQRGG